MDCDQDVWSGFGSNRPVRLSHRPALCFYRAVTTHDGDTRLSLVDAARLFDPTKIYRK